MSQVHTQLPTLSGSSLLNNYSRIQLVLTQLIFFWGWEECVPCYPYTIEKCDIVKYISCCSFIFLSHLPLSDPPIAEKCSAPGYSSYVEKNTLNTHGFRGKESKNLRKFCKCPHFLTELLSNGKNQALWLWGLFSVSLCCHKKDFAFAVGVKHGHESHHFSALKSHMSSIFKKLCLDQVF